MLVNPLASKSDLPCNGTPPLWQRGLLFGKLFGVATPVGFSEKRCLKNLPLCDCVQMSRSSKKRTCPKCGSTHILPIVHYRNKPRGKSLGKTGGATDSFYRVMAGNAVFGRNNKGCNTYPVSYTHLTLPTKA